MPVPRASVITTPGTQSAVQDAASEDGRSHGRSRRRAGPLGITTGPHGALWFGTFAHVARMTTNGDVTQYATEIGGNGALSITTGPDGALWFTATA